MKRTPQQLIDEVYAVVFNAAPDRWLSRKDIADTLGLKKSPHLRATIEALVDSGWLQKQQYDVGAPMPAWFYTITEKRINGEKLPDAD